MGYIMPTVVYIFISWQVHVPGVLRCTLTQLLTRCYYYYHYLLLLLQYAAAAAAGKRSSRVKMFGKKRKNKDAVQWPVHDKAQIPAAALQHKQYRNLNALRRPKNDAWSQRTPDCHFHVSLRYLAASGSKSQRKASQLPQAVPTSLYIVPRRDAVPYRAALCCAVSRQAGGATLCVCVCFFFLTLKFEFDFGGTAARLSFSRWLSIHHGGRNGNASRGCVRCVRQ